MPEPFRAIGGSERGIAVVEQPAHVTLRRARERCGMPLQQVADACGINIHQYQKFESGERDIAGCAFATGLRLCKELGIDPWEFLRPVPIRRRRGSVRTSGASGGAPTARSASPRHLRRLT